MLKNVQLLDCTLREAPVTGMMFGEDFIYKFVRGLENSNIDIIEIGFLKNEEYVKGSTIFNSVEQIVPYISKKKKCKYVALIDYGRYDIEQLSENDGKSIDAIRICFKKGEQKEAIDLAYKIMEKGYEVSIQHVDTLGYSDEEIIDIIHLVNALKPYAYSIVDTFGAMYQNEAERLYSLVNEHLDSAIQLGFHAHNNLMLAGANAQGFIDLLQGRRSLIVDGSVYGCGRGAGNAHTELLMEFMNRKYMGAYDLNSMLDLIDDCIPVLQSKSNWGYSIPYLISGVHGAHVFNVDFLLSRHNIKSKDLREIIDRLDNNEKRMYDFPLLERLYIEHFNHPIDDVDNRKELETEIAGREVLLIAPGPSIQEYSKEIVTYIEKRNPYVIHVNNMISDYIADCIFISSPKRFEEYKKDLAGYGKILLTSNIDKFCCGNYKIFDYCSLVKYGWVNIDNSCILLLRLLLQCNINHITLAGVDGYKYMNDDNFYKIKYKKYLDKQTIDVMNTEIREMLIDVLTEYANEETKISFLTPSIYESVIGR